MSTADTSGTRWNSAIIAIVLLSVVSIGIHAVPLVTWDGRGTPLPSTMATSGSTTTASPLAPPLAAPPTGIAGPTATHSAGPAATPAAMPVYDRACLRRDNPATGAKLPAGDPYGDDIAELGESAQLQRLYAVQAGVLVPLDGLGAPRRCDEQLWALIATATPTLVRHLDQLLVFDSDPDPSTSQWVIEGEATPKQVGPNEFDDDHWRLSFAPNGLDRARLAWLVAHELAHIASMNGGQTLEGISPDVCATWHTGTGCLLRDSFLARYLTNTWDDELWDAWDAADRAPTERARRTAYSRFYDAHQESFVSDYAAWHPIEDFAESFAMWCTHAANGPDRASMPTAKPTDSGRKLAWFDEARRDLLPAFGPGCAMLAEFASS